MSDTKRIFFDLLPMAIAILTGMIFYKRLPAFFRILLLQVFLFLLFDLYGASIEGDNAWVYNGSMLVEVSLILIAAGTYFKTKAAYYLTGLMILLFSGVFIFDIRSMGFLVLAYHAYSVGGIAITGAYLAILFFHFFEKRDQHQSSALVLACLGTILYFSCMLPYLNMMYDLQEEDADSNKELFRLIFVALGTLRYLLVALAFFLHRKSLQLTLQNRS